MEKERPIDWMAAALKDKPANFNTMTRKLFISKGWRCKLTQSYDAQRQRSKDLLGFADLIAFKPAEGPTVLIQACAKSSRAARLRKILQNENAPHWAAHSSREIWLALWHKVNFNWTVTFEKVTTRDFVYYQKTRRLKPCR